MDKSYTPKAKKVLELSEKIVKQLHHRYVGTEHILAALLKEGRNVASSILVENNITIEKLLELMEELIAPTGVTVYAEKSGYSKRTQDVLENARKEAEYFKDDAIGTEHIFLAILKEPDCVATRLLNTMGVNTRRMYADTLISMGYDVATVKEELKNKNGRNTATVETPMLDRYSRDLTKLAKDGKLDPVIGRHKEMQRLIQSLSRRGKNNPCLIGEPGVGKTAIVEGLAHKIIEGNVPQTMENKRVISLDLSGMVAGSKYRGEFEERIKKVIAEVTQAGNILLFLDEIHTIIGAGGAEGSIDASSILKPSLARGEIQLIGATTIEEYRKHIEKDAALERRFQPIIVEEPTIEESIEILHGVRECYQAHHQVTITEEALSVAVKMSHRYINDRFLPDKAIDLIDEAASRVRLEGTKSPGNVQHYENEIKGLSVALENALLDGNLEMAAKIKKEKEVAEKNCQKAKIKYEKDRQKNILTVDADEVAIIVSEWTKIPVKKLEEGEVQRLQKLEATLHKRVIGQENAVTAIAKAVRRGRVGLKDPNRPIGSFLFLGPTGVGKTEICKALAEAVFGEEQSMIRIDMSEYMEKHSVSKLIGSPPGYVGYEEGGQLSEKVRRKPYSVILLDEIEKAHPDVFNILLQVLDDGHITDSQGRKVDFKNTILIMTSNAGAKSIVEPKRLGFISKEDTKENYEHMKNGVMEEVKRIFKPEFLNRIDETIVFHSLEKNHMKKIVTLMTKSLMERCEKQMQIQLTIRDSVKNYIVEKAYDPKYGARPLRRMIQNKLEDGLAEEILAGKIRAGDHVQVTLRKKEIVFQVLENTEVS